MPYTISFNGNLKLIELVPSGALTSQQILDGTDEFIFLLEKHSATRILIDASAIESVESVIDFYDQPQQYEDGGMSRNVRIAIVIPAVPAAEKAIRFYEDVCVNRSWGVSSFEERNAAVKWLTSGG